ncbi:MAG: Pycsar system effector family protein [Acidimicrobiales bacterium]
MTKPLHFIKRAFSSVNSRPTDAATDSSWKVRDALDSWTAKVDAKASIVLALEVAVFGFAIELSTRGQPLAGFRGAGEYVLRGGYVLFAASVIMALMVVMPQLGRRDSKRNWSEGTIYFGHLRHWQMRDLAEALSSGAPTSEQIAAQLIVLSKVIWRKHSWLQWSLLLFIAGVVMLALAGLKVVT